MLADRCRERAPPTASPTCARSSTSCGATATSSSSRRQVDARLEAAEIHRRVIAAGGPALLFTQRPRAPTSRSSPTCSAPRGAPSSPSARGPVRLDPAARRARRDAPAADAGQALGRARRRPARRCASASKRRRSGPVTEVVTRRRAARPPAGAHLLAGGRRAVRHAAARLHRAPRRAGAHNLGMYRMQVHDARTTGMHWQIGKGGGFHYAVAEARGEALPVTVFLGGPPALILAAIAPLPENVPELMLASLDRRASGSRAARGRGRTRSSPSAEFALVGDVPPRRAPARGAVRRSLRLLLAAPRLPGLRRRARSCRRRDAIYPATVVGKPRQEDFFIGDLLQELLSPLFPLVMPAVARPLVLRRDRLPLARGGGRARALRARGDGLAPSASSARASSRSPSSCSSTDRPRRPARLPRDARARPRAHRARDRPLRLLEPLDGHARLHRARGQRGLEGRVARPRRSGARAAARVPAAGAAARRRHATCASSAAAASSSAARGYADDPGAARPPRRAPGLRAAGRSSSSPTSRSARRASAMNFLWTTFTRFEPAADIHAAATRVVRNHVRPRAADR